MARASYPFLAVTMIMCSLAPGIHLAHRKIGQHGALVLLSGKTLRGTFHDPDNLEEAAIDFDPFSGRIDGREQALVQVLADGHHRHPAIVLGIGEEASVQHLDAARGIAFFGAAHLYLVHFFSLVPGFDQVIEAGEKISAGVLDRGAALLDGVRILERQRLTPPFLGRYVATEAAGELEDDHVVGAERLDDFGDRPVEAGDDGPDTDDGSGSDHHAENGQEGPQLGFADAGQRHLDAGNQRDGFGADALRRCGSVNGHSYLNASIGSSIAARRAG